jgi:uncharacterized protein (TIGR04540 family)
MTQEYLLFPTSVKSLAFEIKAACNDYYARKISNDQIREVILGYAENVPEKLFFANDLNPTVKTIIGKKRIDLINGLLSGYQLRLD